MGAPLTSATQRARQLRERPLTKSAKSVLGQYFQLLATVHCHVMELQVGTTIA